MRKLLLAFAVAVIAAPALGQETPNQEASPQPPPPPSAVPAPVYPPPYPSQPPPPPPGWERNYRHRDSWYIGFGIGTGNGRVTLDDGTHFSFSDGVGGDASSVSANFKVGGTLTPKLLLGFDLTALRTQGKSVDTLGFSMNTAIQVTNYDVMLTYFPMEQGLFFRGGLGLAVLRQDVSVGGVSLGRSRSGVGAVLGGGYAFWLGRSFNLTLNLDLSGQSYGKQADEPKSSSAVNFWLGFDWY